MATTTRFQRKYDHRLRELVRATGNIEVARKRGVPPSTARGWVKATKAEVVTIDIADIDLARRHDRSPPSRRQSRLPARCHRQLLTPHTRLEGLRNIQSQHHG